MGKIKLLVTLCVLGVVVGVPVVGYFGFVHDVSDKVIEYDENYRAEDMLNDLVANCLDKTKSDKKISFAITDTQINNVLHNEIKDTEITNYIPNIYCEFKDGYYDFYIQVKPKQFQSVGTKIKIRTTLEEKIREDMDNENCFVFTFKDIYLGKISGMQKIAITALKKFTSEEQIQEMLGGSINIKVKLDEGAIVYKKSDLKNDVDKILGDLSDGVSNSFPLQGLIKALFANDLIHIGQDDGSISFDIDCTPMSENDEYVESYDLKLNDETKYGGITLDKINADVQKVINANEGIEDEKGTIFNYLLKGYAALSPSDKARVDNINWRCLGDLFDYDHYEGIQLSGNTIDSFAASQIEALKSREPTYFLSDTGFDLITIDEVALNNYMRSTGVIGYNFIIGSETAEGYKTSYICVDNLYTNIYNDYSEFVIGLNLNGLETSMILSTSLDTTNSVANFDTKTFKINYDIIGMKLGSLEMPKDFTDSICGILGGNLSDGIQIKKNGSKYTMTIDMSNAIQSSVNETLSTILSQCNFSFATTGENKDANGVIAIKGMKK